MARKPCNELEEKFLAALREHGPKIKEAFAEAKKLSDKYGIPFGNYVPKSFCKTYLRGYDYETDTEFETVDTDWVGQIAPVDPGFWQSSTTECEILNGYT
jgi:hypothetical protein